MFGDYNREGVMRDHSEELKPMIRRVGTGDDSGLEPRQN